MKERPILFSGPMVRAILAGEKTQTRRIAAVRGIGCDFLTDPSAQVPCPHGVTGDRLWVRETWGDCRVFYDGDDGDSSPPQNVAYAADRSAVVFGGDLMPRSVPSWDIAQWNWNAMKWRSSIFMPRWASRITLEIVSVRAERLQDITEADARAEGFTRENVPPMLRAADPRKVWPIARDDRELFALGWDAINGDLAPWASNPWVWVIQFSRLSEAQA